VAYPQSLLSEDESVVLDTRPHWILLVRPVVILLVVAAVTGFVAAILPDKSWTNNARWIIILVAFVLLLILCLRRFLQWLTTNYVITTHRVVLRTGILSRSGRDVPLSRINDVSFLHRPIERLLRSGTLIVESAGERGQVTLADMPHVEEVQRTLYQLVEDDDARRRRSADDEDDDAPTR
jgi:uncharacterized membrane protein YdbT with pleckstrin-like domain